MTKALLLLHPGCEEIEAVVPADILRRAGVEVTLASVTSEVKVTGAHGIALIAETALSDCANDPFQLLVIPGGPGVAALRKHPEVLYVARKFQREGNYVGAICSAPLVLLDAGMLAGHSVTSFPGDEAELRGKVRAYSTDRVCVDGKLITARGPGVAEEFALTLVRILMGPEIAEKVRQGIVAR